MKKRNSSFDDPGFLGPPKKPPPKAEPPPDAQPPPSSDAEQLPSSGMLPVPPAEEPPPLRDSDPVAEESVSPEPPEPPEPERPQEPHSEKPAAPPRQRIRRVRLRHKILLTMLLLALVPGYLVLLLMWVTFSAPIEAKTRDDTFERARGLSLEMDRRLGEVVNGVRRVATHDAFNAQVEETLENHYLGLIDEEATFSEPLFQRPDSLWNASLYLVNHRGQLIAHVEENSIRFRFDAPSSLAGARLLDRISDSFPEGTFIAEAEHQDWNYPRMVAGAPLGQLTRGKQQCVLVALVPLGPILEQVERNNPYIGQRLIVLSRADGLVYSTQRDEDLRLTLNRDRELFFVDNPDAELTRITVRQRPLGIGFSPVRTMTQNSGSGNMPRVDWVVLQAVDVEEALALVRPVFWAAILLGLALTAVAVPLAVILSGRIVSPILQLTEGVQRYSRGELDYRINIRTGDELELLANSTNEMAESLRATLDDLASRVEEVDEKARQLELIHAISYSVNRVLDLDKLFRRIIKELLRHIPCERISLGLLTEDRNHLGLNHVYPTERDVMPRGTELAVDGSLMGRALHDQAVTLRLVREDGRYVEDRMLAPIGMKVICIVPLIATNGPVGTLNLASADEECFSAPRIKLLERIADSLALGVEHSRLFSRVARFAEELEDTVEMRTEELKAAQARLVQAEKFAATGSIAAHIAHEVNNPLSIIKNYLKITGSRLERAATGEADAHVDPESVKANLAIISEEIDRIARIINQLRQVSKPERAEVRDIDLQDELRKLHDLFDGTLRKRGIDIEMDLEPDLRNLRLTGDHLRQIVINLLRNAMDAMEESEVGGIITVRTRFANEERDRFVLEVADTGPGIPEEVLNKIFDPFFTTKGEGKGTGLGLSVSYGLAQNMGGTMEVESAEGEGATLRLILPVVAADPSGTQDSSDDGDEERPVVRRQGSKIIIG